jgi:hypothetical protein
MNLKLKIRVQNCRNIEKKYDAIFENVIENIMNINCSHDFVCNRHYNL